MKKDIGAQFLCKDCEYYNSCEYYHNRKRYSYICKNFHLPNKLDKLRAEIEEKYGNYDICEWFEDYDYEENDVSEYRLVGGVSDILAIIDRYRAESGGERGEH